MKRPGFVLGVPAMMLSAHTVAAAPPPINTSVAVAKAGRGQPALAVGFDAGGLLRASVCRAEPCTTDGAPAVDVPEEARAHIQRARLMPVRVGADRSAVVVTIPIEPDRAYEAVLAAPLAGNEVKVVFAGYTGFLSGVEGERSGPRIVVGDSVYVGEAREDRTLCGRPALLSPRVLNPATLELASAKLQRLPQAERDAATVLQATATEKVESQPVLRPIWATSAAPGQPPDAVADGKADTAWAEGRGGAGRGEFVVLRAPTELPLVGFDFVFLPEGAAATGRRDGISAPRELWLVTDGSTFRVDVPASASSAPGSVYGVKLPAPENTRCLAVVVESAEKEGKDTRVAVAEITARTEFDSASAADLVKALRGGGPRGEAAAAALRSTGAVGFAAVAASFSDLDEAGRRLALDVMDHAACPTKLPVYLAALMGRDPALREAARDRIRLCGEESAAPLLAALRTGTEETRAAVAQELSIVAPDVAIRELTRALTGSSKALRRAYRVAIADASRSQRAVPAVREALSDTTLSRVALVDLLRALGSRVGAYGSAAQQAFARALAGAPFRERYLLLPVAAHLEGTDPAARRALTEAIRGDEDAHIRAQAARVIETPASFQKELLAALSDPAVRVREAAAQSLGTRGGEFAVGPLSNRLAEDPWPLVRAAAAQSLASFGARADVDRALAQAAEADESPAVRAPALRALGERRAVAQAAVVTDRLEDDDELPSVRAAAALALGRMCYGPALPKLTKTAQQLADPRADEGAREIARAALAALGILKPADLRERLAPLLSKGVPTVYRLAAGAALAAPGGCGAAMKTAAR